MYVESADCYCIRWPGGVSNDRGNILMPKQAICGFPHDGQIFVNNKQITIIIDGQNLILVI